MGSNASKGSKQQQQTVKKTLSDMCEAVSKAILEVAKLEESGISEAGVATAGQEVIKLCGQQAQQSMNELTRVIRREKLKMLMKEGGVAGSDPLQKLQANLLFLELLRLHAARDGSSGGSSESSGGVTGEGETAIAHPWTRKEDLGKGAFGSVYAAVDKNGIKFAVKEVSRDGVEEKCLREEIKFLGNLSHKNIVKIFGCAGDEEKFYMYMEIMQGSVRDRIEKSGQPISPRMAKGYSKDLLQGLVYLHGKNVIHRDIKCANVLLDASGTAKLADMGISKKHDQETMANYSDDAAGTICWMSPEVISGMQGGKRSDIWSVGCTVYEMVKGSPPFAEELPPALFLLLLPKMIQNLEHRQLVSKQDELGPALQNFLLKIFVKMDDRPFADQISDHPKCIGTLCGIFHSLAHRSKRSVTEFYGQTVFRNKKRQFWEV